MEKEIERFLERKISKSRYRAVQINIDFNLTKEYVYTLFEKQKGRCALSDLNLTCIKGKGRVDTNVSIDRINSSLGYTEGNIQLVCSVINSMKNDLTMKELIFFCKRIIGTYEK